MAAGKNDRSGLLHATAKKCWPVVALLLWTMSSSGLIVLNKRLMVNDGFAFPMALTAAGQTASFLGGMLHNLRTRCSHRRHIVQEHAQRCASQDATWGGINQLSLFDFVALHSLLCESSCKQESSQSCFCKGADGWHCCFVVLRLMSVKSGA